MITPSHLWYFVVVGQESKSGPLTDAQMIEKFQQGLITGETLVWNESLPAWQQLSKCKLAGSLGLSEADTRKTPPKLKPTPPPIRKDNESTWKERFTFKSIVWVLIGIFILGCVGLYIEFQSHKEWGSTISQYCAVALVAGKQAALDQYHAENPKAPDAQTNATSGSTQPEQPALVSTISTPSIPDATPVVTPEATPPPPQEVNSSNPIIYSGSFINRTTGDTGDLVLRVEHLIATGGGQITFGGTLLSDNAPTSITGIYSPESSHLSFSPGVQSGIAWNAMIEGDSMRGIFSRKVYNGNEGGIWQVKHSGGLSLQKAVNAAASSAPQVTTPQISLIDGTYSGTFFLANLNTNRTILIAIKATGQPSGSPATVPIHGSLLFVNGNEDDALNGTVTYSTNTTFTLGWNDTNGIMQFNGRLTNHEIIGTWVLDPKNGKKMCTGTFDAAQSSNQLPPSTSAPGSNRR